jgi:hypothetical protein
MRNMIISDPGGELESKILVWLPININALAEFWVVRNIHKKLKKLLRLKPKRNGKAPNYLRSYTIRRGTYRLRSKVILGFV